MESNSSNESSSPTPSPWKRIVEIVTGITALFTLVEGIRSNPIFFVIVFAILVIWGIVKREWVKKWAKIGYSWFVQSLKKIRSIWIGLRKRTRVLIGGGVFLTSLIVVLWFYFFPSMWSDFDRKVHEALTANEMTEATYELQNLLLYPNSERSTSWYVNGLLRSGLLDLKQEANSDTTKLYNLISLCSSLSDDLIIPSWSDKSLIKSYIEKAKKDRPQGQLVIGNSILVFVGHSANDQTDAVVRELRERFSARTREDGFNIQLLEHTLPWSEFRGFYRDVIANITRAKFILSFEENDNIIFSAHDPQRRFWTALPLSNLKITKDEWDIDKVADIISAEDSLSIGFASLFQGNHTEAITYFDTIYNSLTPESVYGTQTILLKSIEHVLLGEYDVLSTLSKSLERYNTNPDYYYVDTVLRMAQSFAPNLENSTSNNEDLSILIQFRKDKMGPDAYKMVETLYQIGKEGDRFFNPMIMFPNSLQQKNTILPTALAAEEEENEGTSVGEKVELESEATIDDDVSKLNALIEEAKAMNRKDLVTLARIAMLPAEMGTSKRRELLNQVLDDTKTEELQYLNTFTFLHLFPDIATHFPDLYSDLKWKRTLKYVVDESTPIASQELQRGHLARILERGISLLAIARHLGVPPREAIEMFLEKMEVQSIESFENVFQNSLILYRLYALYQNDPEFVKEQLDALMSILQEYSSRKKLTPNQHYLSAIIRAGLSWNYISRQQYEEALEHTKAGLGHLGASSDAKYKPYLKAALSTQAWILNIKLESGDKLYQDLAKKDIQAALRYSMEQAELGPDLDQSLIQYTDTLFSALVDIGDLYALQYGEKINEITFLRQALDRVEQLDLQIDDLSTLPAIYVQAAELLLNDIILIYSTHMEIVDEDHDLYSRVKDKSQVLTDAVREEDYSKEAVFFTDLSHTFHTNLGRFAKHITGALESDEFTPELAGLLHTVLDQIHSYASEGFTSNDFRDRLFEFDSTGAYALSASYMLQIELINNHLLDYSSIAENNDLTSLVPVPKFDQEDLGYELMDELDDHQERFDQWTVVKSPAQFNRLQRYFYSVLLEDYGKSTEILDELVSSFETDSNHKFMQTFFSIFQAKTHFHQENYEDATAVLLDIYEKESNSALKKYFLPYLGVNQAYNGNLNAASSTFEQYFDYVDDVGKYLGYTWKYQHYSPIGVEEISAKTGQELSTDGLITGGSDQMMLTINTESEVENNEPQISVLLTPNSYVPWFYALYKGFIDLGTGDINLARESIEYAIDYYYTTGVGDYSENQFSDYAVWLAVYADLWGLNNIARDLIEIARLDLEDDERSVVNLITSSVSDEVYLPDGLSFLPGIESIKPHMKRLAQLTGEEDLIKVQDQTVENFYIEPVFIPRQYVESYIANKLVDKVDKESTPWLKVATSNYIGNTSNSNAPLMRLAKLRLAQLDVDSSTELQLENILPTLQSLIESGYDYSAFSFARDVPLDDYSEVLSLVEPGSRGLSFLNLHYKKITEALLREDLHLIKEICRLILERTSDTASSKYYVVQQGILPAYVSALLETESYTEFETLAASLGEHESSLNIANTYKVLILASQIYNATPSQARRLLREPHAEGFELQTLPAYLIAFLDIYNISKEEQDYVKVQEAAEQALNQFIARSMIEAYYYFGYFAPDQEQFVRLQLLEEAHGMITSNDPSHPLGDNIKNLLLNYYADQGLEGEFAKKYIALFDLDKVAENEESTVAFFNSNYLNLFDAYTNLDSLGHSQNVLDLRFPKKEATRRLPGFEYRMLSAVLNLMNEEWEKGTEELGSVFKRMPDLSDVDASFSNLVSNILSVTTNIYLQSQKYEQLIDLLNSLSEGALETGHHFQVAVGLSLANKELGNNEERHKYLRQAIQLARKENDEKLLLQSYDELYDYWNSQNNPVEYTKALEAEIDTTQYFGYWSVAYTLMGKRLEVSLFSNQFEEFQKTLRERKEFATKHEVLEGESDMYYWDILYHVNQDDMDATWLSAEEYFNTMLERPELAEEGSATRVIWLLKDIFGGPQQIDRYKEKLKEVQEDIPVLLSPIFAMNIAIALGDIYFGEDSLLDATNQYVLAIKLGHDVGNQYVINSYNQKIISNYRLIVEAYFSAEKFDEVRETVKELDRLDNSNEKVTLFISLADAYVERTMYNEAAELYKKVTLAIPKSGNAAYSHASLGWIYNRQDRHADAVKELEQATRLVTEEAWYFYQLGLAYRGVEENGLAIKAFEKSIRADPNYYFSYNQLVSLYHDTLFEYDFAYKYAQRAVEYSNNISYRSNFAEVNFTTSRFQEAYRLAQEVLEGQSSISTKLVMQMFMASSMRILGNEEQAKDEVLQLLDLHEILGEGQRVGWIFDGVKHFVDTNIELSRSDKEFIYALIRLLETEKSNETIQQFLEEIPIDLELAN